MKIASYLPQGCFSNQEFTALGWDPERIFSKTGINNRHISSPEEHALDLAEKACERLFSKYQIDKNSIDYLVYCTQSPDYIVPNNACLLQDRLGLSIDIGAFDYNLGCSGYVYGLGIAKGLLLSGQAKRLLLVTTDTYTKYINDDDRSSRSIFGDGACATLLTEEDAQHFGNFVFGTDGRGADVICVKGLGLSKDHSGHFEKAFTMKGPAVFRFALQAAPKIVKRLYEKDNLHKDDVDFFVLHQANAYMLEHIRQRLDVPAEKFPIYLEDVGNTVSSTIPLALEHFIDNNTIQPGAKIVTIGFGVGYSWAACSLTLQA